MLVTNHEVFVIVMYVSYRITAYVPGESDVGSYEGVRRYEWTEENETLFDGTAENAMGRPLQLTGSEDQAPLGVS